MALTFPLDMRTLFDAGIRFRPPVFDLVPRVATIALPNRLQAMETAPAVWKASFETAHLKHAQRLQVEAFLNALGGVRSFLAFDPFRQWPVGFPGGQLSFPQTVVATAITATSVTVPMDAAHRITAGDRFGLEQGGQYVLVTALETVQGAGTATIPFAPAIVPSRFSAMPTVRYYRPVVEMILMPGEPPAVSDHFNRFSVAFKAIQRR